MKAISVRVARQKSAINHVMFVPFPLRVHVYTCTDTHVLMTIVHIVIVLISDRGYF